MLAGVDRDHVDIPAGRNERNIIPVVILEGCNRYDRKGTCGCNSNGPILADHIAECQRACFMKVQAAGICADHAEAVDFCVKGDRTSAAGR